MILISLQLNMLIIMLVMLLCEKKSGYLKLKLEINTILLFVLLVCLFVYCSLKTKTNIETWE